MCDFTKMSAEVLIGMYVSLRNDKAKTKKQQEEELGKFDIALEAIEKEMHTRLNQAGVDAMKTKNGTAFKKSRTSVTVSDKSAFMEFVKNKDQFGLLDVKANKTAVTDYLVEHQELPPGVSSVSEEIVGFRCS